MYSLLQDTFIYNTRQLKNLRAVLRNIQQNEIHTDPISDDVDQVLRRCLRVDPDERCDINELAQLTRPWLLGP